MLLLKILPALAIAALACLVAAAAEPDRTEATGKTSPLDFTLPGNDGKPYDLGQHKGQVVMIVNVASKCGLTPQYDALQKLYAANQAKGFVIVGVPSNQFGGQEPGSDAEIKEFCSTKYSVTFPLLAKGDVKGSNQLPLYRHLTKESPFPGDIGWNFAKFLVGRDGKVVARFSPRTAPDATEVAEAVAKALAIAKP